MYKKKYRGVWRNVQCTSFFFCVVSKTGRRGAFQSQFPREANEASAQMYEIEPAERMCKN